MSRIVAASKSVRIAHSLETEIRSGSLALGAPLESENALVRRFAVSRNTVRKSLGILSAKGLIATKSGIGSFVTYGGAIIDAQAGWTVGLSAKGAASTSRILRLARAPMDLGETPVPPGTDCLHLDRLRLNDATGLGLSLERSRVPWCAALAPVLETGLNGGSLNRTLQVAGLAAASGEEWAGCLPALSPADAALMGRPVGAPMLRLRRVTRASNGAVIEYVESLLDPDLFGLHMEF